MQKSLSKKSNEVKVSNRKFGFVVGGLLIIAPILLTNLFLVKATFLAIGGALVVAALVRPSALRLLNTWWAWLGDGMHNIMSPVILGILFFFLLTPIALLRRLFHRDPLKLKFQKDLKTYWNDSASDKEISKSLKYQF